MTIYSKYSSAATAVVPRLSIIVDAHQVKRYFRREGSSRITKLLLVAVRIVYYITSRTGKAPTTLTSRSARNALTLSTSPIFIILIVCPTLSNTHSVTPSIRMFCTRRPPTLSINELNHILSESLDIERLENVNVSDTILHDPLPSAPEKQKTSTFHRLFSRSSSHLPLVPRSPILKHVDEPVTPSPRKMAFTWRLSRLSPHRSHRAEEHTVCI